MADNEFYKIDKLDKLIAHKTKAQARTYMKDGDLQIHLSNIKDPEIVNFSNILSTFMAEIDSIKNPPITAGVHEREDVQKEMEGAENSFEQMMEIRKVIEEAYKEFIQLQG